MNTYLSEAHRMSFANLLLTRKLSGAPARTAEPQKDGNVAPRLDVERRPRAASPRPRR